MANEYISREAAVEKITALINKSGKYTAYESGAEDACYIVENEIPAAEVRPVVYGEWIDYKPEDPYDPRMKCSRCGIVLMPTCDSVFCSKCGAYMGGTDNGSQTN